MIVYLYRAGYRSLARDGDSRWYAYARPMTPPRSGAPPWPGYVARGRTVVGVLIAARRNLRTDRKEPA